MEPLERMHRIARKLDCLPEREMHWRVLLDALRKGEADDAAALVESILSRPAIRDRRPDHLRVRMLEVLSGAAPVPDDAIDYDFKRALYAAADARGADAVKRHLRSLPEQADPDVLERRVPKDIAAIPLGRRRSLAKGENRDMLDKLALDPDPIVTVHLLRNPRTREADVVRIAALRPIAGDTLRAIDAEPRWHQRPVVRTAIARNPFCPIDLAMKLVATLGTGVLRDIASDSGIPFPTREAIECELEAREPVS